MLPPRVALLVAQALHCVHTLSAVEGRPLSIVSRDIWPARLLLSQDGAVTLTDFGNAHSGLNTAPQEDLPPQRPLRYSPEQLQHAVAAPHSDLFSLAVILEDARCSQ